MTLLAILALTALPTALAQTLGPAGRVRIHTFLNVWDFHVYLSAMREAAQTGHWLVHNHFAAEPHQPVLIHVPYVAIGLLARGLGLEPMIVYVAAEWAARLAVGAAALAYVRLMLPPGRVRPLALALALCGSGLGFWSALVGYVLGRHSAETLYYETNTLTILFSGIHLMLALVLSVASIGLFGRFCRAPAGWRTLLLLATTSALLSLTQPHHLPVLGTAFGLFAATQLRPGRRLPWRAAIGLLAFAGAAAPVLAYDYLTFGRDALWSISHWQQNVVPSPQGWALVSHLGLPLLLAPIGLLGCRGDGQRRLLSACLVIATLVWLSAPVPYQRRFAFGLPLYLAPPAALAVAWLWQRLPQPRQLWGRVLSYGLALGVGATSAAMYLAVLTSAVGGWPYPSYPATTAEAAAAEWLARHSQADQVVLSGLESGYILAASIPGRVVVGHPHETPRFADKQQLVKRFFSDETAEAERSALARSVGADYVFYGPREQRLGPPPASPGFRLVYQQDGVEVYEVRRP